MKDYNKLINKLLRISEDMRWELLTEAARVIRELQQDAARYQWLRDEHYLINPVAAVVWKKNDDREECEWVNTVDGYSLDCHIDAAMKGTE